MITPLVAGVVLGLSAGFLPGPLLTLVISHTLRHGIKEGIKIAIAPLVTDIPIVLIAVFVLTRLAHFQSILGSISLVGGIFVLYLAYDCFRTSRLDMNVQDAEPQSLGKGVLVNALNPHPYLFWVTVGAPMMIKAWKESPLMAIAFLTGFYVCLVGSKVFIATLAGTSRQLLIGRTYGYLMRILAVLLLLCASILFKEGLHLLGVL